MTKKANEARERVRKEVMDEPDIWFDLRYRIKYNSKTSNFEFKNIHKVPSARSRATNE